MPVGVPLAALTVAVYVMDCPETALVWFDVSVIVVGSPVAAQTTGIARSRAVIAGSRPKRRVSPEKEFAISYS